MSEGPPKFIEVQLSPCGHTGWLCGMPEFMARPMPWKPAGWVLCYCGRKAKLVREAYIGVGGFVHNTGRMWEWSRRKNKWMAAKKNRRHRKKITKAMDKVILPIPYRVVK